MAERRKTIINTAVTRALVPPPAPAPVAPQDYASIIGQIQDSLPFNRATSARDLVNALNQRGILATIGTHANGTAPSEDAVVLPDGTWFDASTDQSWNKPSKFLHWDPSVNVMTADGKFVPYGDFLTSKGLPVPKFTPMPGDGLPMPGRGKTGTIGMGGGAVYGQGLADPGQSALVQQLLAKAGSGEKVAPPPDQGTVYSPENSPPPVEWWRTDPYGLKRNLPSTPRDPNMQYADSAQPGVVRRLTAVDPQRAALLMALGGAGDRSVY